MRRTGREGRAAKNEGSKGTVRSVNAGRRVLSSVAYRLRATRCGPGAALFALVRDHNARHEDFASLRLCMSGGDKISAALEREFEELAGIQIDEGYGMTETGISTVNPPSGLNKIGTVGQHKQPQNEHHRRSRGRTLSLQVRYDNLDT